MPSVFEGMSNAILEAMAARRAIIASDIPENRELIENKKSGVLIPFKNPQLLGKTILELIEDHYQRIMYADAAFAKVASEFSMKKSIEKLDQALAVIFK